MVVGMSSKIKKVTTELILILTQRIGTSDMIFYNKFGMTAFIRYLISKSLVKITVPLVAAIKVMESEVVYLIFRVILDKVSLIYSDRAQV